MSATERPGPSCAPLGPNPSPVVLVGGTFWTRQHPAWPRETSSFSKELKTHGLALVNDQRGFGAWSGALNGVPYARLGEWSAAGEALYWYLVANGHGPHQPPASVITHSHGGHVLAYAAKFGACFDVVVTLACPVRHDMKDEYLILRSRSRRWIHVHAGGSDAVQLLGSVFSGTFGFRREMPTADVNVLEAGVGHSGVHDPQLWTSRGWWSWLQRANP